MKLSLLSAVRNEEQHIREMIEGCLRQDHEDWELLFVDDGSTDATVKIIEEFASSDTRVRLVGKQEAKGKVSAFNAAFRASVGGVICIHGGDDISRPGSFKDRLAPFANQGEHGTFAMFKLRSFSKDPKFDGMVLPKGDHGSRSGPSLTMSRDLAEKVFPIPESLVAEDTYLGIALESVAERVVHGQAIVVDYRIHAGNSNPRHKPFPQMSEAAHARAMAYEELLNAKQLPLTEQQVRLCRARLEMDRYRYQGQWWRILTVREAAFRDRMASVAGSRPLFFKIRTRFYSLFSGLRSG